MRGGVPRHIPLWRRVGSLVLLWRWVTPFSRQPRRFSRCPKWAGLGGGPLCHVMILAREPQRAAVLGRRGLEPQFSDRVTSINLYATRPKGVLVFPSRQIFTVPRFCQQITGAITASRLEGLTSGLRITQTAIPLKRSSLAVSTLNWHRRLDLNQRMRESKSLALPLGYVCVVPLRELPARCRVRCRELTGTAPAYGVELIKT